MFDTITNSQYQDYAGLLHITLFGRPPVSQMEPPVLEEEAEEDILVCPGGDPEGNGNGDGDNGGIPKSSIFFISGMPFWKGCERKTFLPGGR